MSRKWRVLFTKKLFHWKRVLASAASYVRRLSREFSLVSAERQTVVPMLVVPTDARVGPNINGVPVLKYDMAQRRFVGNADVVDLIRTITTTGTS